jgi:hypothetical protein
MSRKKLCPLTKDQSLRFAAEKMTAKIEQDFPAGVAKPALRALAGAGFSKLSDLVTIRESELAELHGMGPKAMALLHDALEGEGLAFRPEKKTPNQSLQPTAASRRG